MPEHVSGSGFDGPLTFLRPKLLSHKPSCQVVISKAKNDGQSGTATPCVLKFFSPKALAAYEKELSVYRSEGARNVRPQKLWSGSWVSSKYLEFLGGNLPSILRKSDSQVYALILSYIEGVDVLSQSHPAELQIHAVKAALHSLRILHSARIVHGDVSLENLLLQHDGDKLHAFWIDFSASSVNAKAAAADHEWQQAVAYFSHLINVQSALILPSEQLSPIPSPLLPSDEYIDPLPEIQPDTVFSGPTYVAEGTHAIIYKITIINKGREMNCCLKLFREGWMTPFNLERTAYTHLRHAGVTYHIPEVYGWGKRTMKGWGLDGDGQSEYYGIVMEWLEGAQPINQKNVSLEHAVTLTYGLAKIHDAGILHFDGFDRNMMIFPGSNRAVWLDFSCAQVEAAEFAYRQETYSSGAVPICKRMREEGKVEVLQDNFLSSMGIYRRISAILYVLWLVPEGIFIFADRLCPSISVSTSGLETLLMYLVGSSFALAVLHSYVGGKLAKSGLRAMMFGHQLILLSLSLYSSAVVKHANARLWHGFRIAIMGYCAFSEMGGLLVDLRNQSC